MFFDSLFVFFLHNPPPSFCYLFFCTVLIVLATKNILIYGGRGYKRTAGQQKRDSLGETVGDTDGFPSPRLSHQTKAERRPRVMLPLLSNSSVEMKTWGDGGREEGEKEEEEMEDRWRAECNTASCSLILFSRRTRTRRETGRYCQHTVMMRVCESVCLPVCLSVWSLTSATQDKGHLHCD